HLSAAQPAAGLSYYFCVRAEHAFSLVEILGILVVLGTLAVVALPRYRDLSDAAGRSAFEETAHSFRLAVFYVHTQYVLSSRSGNVDNLQGYGDGTVDTNANGYPTDTADANTIPNNATGATRCA